MNAPTITHRLRAAGSTQQRPHGARLQHHGSKLRGDLRVRADGDEPSKGKGTADKKQTEVDKKVKLVIQQMRKDGVDEKVARKVLQSWRDKNVGDKDSFRSKVLGKGATVVGLALFQLTTDVLAAYCSSATGAALDGQTFNGADLAVLALRVLFVYFSASAVLDLFRLGTVLASTALMGTRAGNLYGAIEELAEGGTSGIALVDKAQAAVSTAKVVIALNSVRRVLKDKENLVDAFDNSTLSSLTAMFVLRHAEETYGWSPDKVEGLSLSDATQAAAIFGKFDANLDYRLETSEFRRLCDAADFNLSEEEAKSALQFLDKRGNGYIEFDEFAAWYVARDIKPYAQK